MSLSEAERKREEGAARRHARLDNAGVLTMSAAGEMKMDKITIVRCLLDVGVCGWAGG